MFPNLNMEDNVVKNMAKEIVRDCGLAGTVVSVDVAMYLVHLKFLIPTYGFSQDKVMDRNFTEPIIEECVQDFTGDSVWINTLKMQSYSESNSLDRESTKNEQEENMWKKARPLLKEVVRMDPTDKDGKDKLYKKMVLFTVVHSGLGNPTFNSVLREAQAALQSIFRFTDLDRFIPQSEGLKEEQLIELSKIANGIRLFNKDCQKGGDGIDDLPLILTQASHITKERINNMLELLMKRIVKLTSAFDVAYALSQRRKQVLEENVTVTLPAEFTPTDLDRMKRVLYMIREHEYYLKKLLVVAEETTSSIAVLIDRFRETLLQLHDIVRYRSAVPTVQVYPPFIVLSQIWEEMQKEAAVLSDINSFVGYLQSFAKYEEQTPLEVSLNAMGPDKKKHEEELGNVGVINRSQMHKGVTVIGNPDEGLLNEAQFGGYCAWTLAATEGLLLPGSAQVGFLRYKNRIYTFSSVLTATLWSKDPDHYIVEVYRAARSKLELVRILNLYDDLFQIKSQSLQETKGEERSLSNKLTQTEVHPIKCHIDRNYTFSEWEYRRRALQLSHIINYQTKSQQTVNHSHFRASIGFQASPGKSKSTQTLTDNVCNHPLVSSYLYGLRGHYQDKFQVLDLTRPLDEELRSGNFATPDECS